MEKFTITCKVYFLLTGIIKSCENSTNEMRGAVSFMEMQVSPWGKRVLLVSL